MDKQEEIFILSRINSALEKGPSTWHEVTPELLKDLKRRSRKKREENKR